MPPRPKHRILYVGRDHALLSFLQVALPYCKIVRCPTGRLAQPLIESEIPLIGSEIKYSLLLFDEELPDMTGKELAQFTHSLWHRKKTPILIVEKLDDFGALASDIIGLLG